MSARGRAAALVRPWLPDAVERRVAQRLNRRGKRFIHPSLTVEEFFDRLEERGVRYVALRWFDALPEVAADRDIDILVADADVDRITDLWSYWPSGQQIDLYSESGLPGSAYAPWFLSPRRPHEMALFPPALARGVLDDAVSNGRGVRVPSARHHFFTLGYHVAYLKAERSGLRSCCAGPSDGAHERPSHDYDSELRRLGGEVGIAVPAPLTLEALDEVLAAHGWRPPTDVLERVAVWSPWVRRRFFADESTDAPPGITLFFIRERAVREGATAQILDVLVAQGFEVLETYDLEGERGTRVEALVRGGNWGRGPYPLSGGRPARLVVALDVLPRPPGALTRNHPLLTNARVLTAKQEVRRVLNEKRPERERYNALHSTDSEQQAWRILETIAPEVLPELSTAVGQRWASFTSQDPVLRDLTGHGNRARVELVPRGDGVAVRKTFKPHCSRFLEREIAVLTDLADTPWVPALLEKGSNHFIVEHVEDVWGGRPPRLLPMEVIRQLSSFVHACARSGWDPIDLTLQRNLMLDRHGDLKVVDYEFYADRNGPFPPERAYALIGVPPGFDGDVPAGVERVYKPYPKHWYPFVGLDIHTFLYGRPWEQSVKRLLRLPGVVVGRMGRRMRRSLRRSVRDKVPRRLVGPLKRSVRALRWGP